MTGLRFPVEAGDTFTLEDGEGSTVTMTVKTTEATWTTPAGTFSPCLVHEARFVAVDETAQTRSADGNGLRVETTLCEGIGEVARSIELPTLPLPVQFTLLSQEELADIGAAEALGDAG